MKGSSSLSQVVLLVVCSAPFVLGQSATIKDFNDIVPQKQNIIDDKENFTRGLAPPRQLWLMGMLRPDESGVRPVQFLDQLEQPR